MKAIFIPALLLCVLLLSFCLTGCRKEPLDPAGSAANTESETIETEAAQKGVYHKLTPKECEVMISLYVEQLSVSDTAAKLGVEKNTVSTHRRNACEKIRTEMEGN